MALFRRRRASVDPPSDSQWPDSVTPRPDPLADRVHQELRNAGVTLPPLVALSAPGAPRPVLGCLLNDGDPLVTWHAVRDRHGLTGYWPVLLGELDSIGETLSFAGGDDDPDLVERGRALDAEAWLREHDPRTLVQQDDDGQDDELAAPDDWGLSADQVGPLTAGEATLVGGGAPTVLALVEAAAGGFEVPALVSWSGAVNYDVLGDVHLAVLRRWYEAYGAELVVLGYDTLEVHVARPPTDPEPALAVGREHYVYCADVVDQGLETLQALVQQQVARHSWYFWWD